MLSTRTSESSKLGTFRDEGLLGEKTMRTEWIALFLGLTLLQTGCFQGAGGDFGGVPGSPTSSLNGSGPGATGLNQAGLNAGAPGQTGINPAGLGANGTGPQAAGQANPGSQGVPTADGRTDFESRLSLFALEYINLERGKVGSGPLQFDDRLNRAALAHSLDMFRRNYMGHITAGSEGRNVEEFGYRTFPSEGAGNGVWGHHRAAKEGYPAVDITDVNENTGEVLNPDPWAEAGNNGRTPEQRWAYQAVYGYEFSEGHWSNMLNPKWQIVGLATIVRLDQAPPDPSGGEPKMKDTQLFAIRRERMKTPFERRPRRAGFSLLEVLILVTILGILSGAFLQAVMGNSSRAKDLQFRTHALLGAQEIMEENWYPVATEEPESISRNFAMGETMAGVLDVFPHATLPGMRHVRVRVSWTDRPGGPRHQVRLDRLVRDRRGGVP